MKDGKTLTASFEFQVRYYENHMILPIFQRVGGFFQIKSSDTSSALEIPKVKPEYAGNYTARVENVAGRADSSANLLVIDRADMGAQPQFTQVMAETRATQGHPVRLDVRVTGKPQPTIGWYKVRIVEIARNGSSRCILVFRTESKLRRTIGSRFW